MSPYLVCCLFEREEYLFIEIRQFRHRWRKDYCRIHSRYWFGLNGDPFLFSVLSISVRNMLLAFCHRVFPSALLVRSKILVLFGLSLVNNVPKHLGFGLGLFFSTCRAGVQLWVFLRAVALRQMKIPGISAGHFSGANFLKNGPRSPLGFVEHEVIDSRGSLSQRDLERP